MPQERSSIAKQIDRRLTVAFNGRRSRLLEQESFFDEGVVIEDEEAGSLEEALHKMSQ